MADKTFKNNYSNQPDQEDEEIFDVDAVTGRKSEADISTSAPASAEKWQAKLDAEDCHIRNIR